MFTQMSSKKGIKLYKEKAVEAIVKECKKLEKMNVVGPEKSTLSHLNKLKIT